MKKYCSVRLSWKTRRSPSTFLCFNRAISNSTRSTENYGRKTESSKSVRLRYYYLAKSARSRHYHLASDHNGKDDRQIYVLLISIPNPSCVQENVVGGKWTLLMTSVFRRWRGKQLRPDRDRLWCTVGLVDGMPRAGSHYNLGTSRGPDKIGSRAGPGPRAVSCTWLAYLFFACGCNLHSSRLNNFNLSNLSSYDNSFIPHTSLVALLWTFSNNNISFA